MAIVNGTGNHLHHVWSVPAAIDKASDDGIQKASNQLVNQHGAVQTGDAIATEAGGKLKCKILIHAIGPIAQQHKQHCGPALLQNACNNAMIIAQKSLFHFHQSVQEYTLYPKSLWLMLCSQHFVVTSVAILYY